MMASTAPGVASAVTWRGYQVRMITGYARLTLCRTRLTRSILSSSAGRPSRCVRAHCHGQT